MPPFAAARQAAAASTLLNAPGGALTVDLPDKRGRAPLLHAAALGHVQLIKTCLMANARIDAADHQVSVPPFVSLCVACAVLMARCQTVLTRRLLLWLMHRQGTTPLMAAVGQARLGAIVELLKANADPCKANNDGKTPLVCRRHASELGPSSRRADQIRSTHRSDSSPPPP